MTFSCLRSVFNIYFQRIIAWGWSHEFVVKMCIFIVHSPIKNVYKLRTKKNTWAETYLQQVSRRLAIKQHKINLDPWWSYYAISWIQPFFIVHFWFFSANSFFRVKWICSVKRMRILTAVNNIFEKPQHLCLLPLKTFVSLRLENMKLKPFNKCKRGFKEN